MTENVRLCRTSLRRRTELCAIRSVIFFHSVLKAKFHCFDFMKTFNPQQVKVVKPRGSICLTTFFTAEYDQSLTRHDTTWLVLRLHSVGAIRLVFDDIRKCCWFSILKIGSSVQVLARETLYWFRFCFVDFLKLSLTIKIDVVHLCTATMWWTSLLHNCSMLYIHSGPQKVYHFYFGNNFAKCWPNWTIFCTHKIKNRQFQFWKCVSL